MHARGLKLVIEYDGTDFAGWQVQPGLRTVQGAIEEAFSDLAREAVSVTGAGRTDAGVHAIAQVAHVRSGLELEAASVAPALNARLDDDVRIRGAEDVPPGFHARHDAVARSYLYLIGAEESPIWRRRRWFVKAGLDVDAMRDALGRLEGEHDFSSFCLTGSEPAHHRCDVRTTAIEWEPCLGGTLAVRVTANRFLRGMVRSIVGTLVEVGRGKLAPAEVDEVLAAMDRGRAGRTAPPWGLYLEEVSYS
jgi:tRNA pseudouridine38-40 synthase